MTWYHPKYYAELRKIFRSHKPQSEEATSLKRPQPQVASDKRPSLQAPSDSRKDSRSSSDKQQAS